MTIRNLKYLFAPCSVALIGAGQTPGTVGSVVADNLFGAGFKGEIFPVGTASKTIEGVETYPDVESLPRAPDLAVIATSPETVPEMIDQLGKRGTRAAVVITGGVTNHTDPHHPELNMAMLAAARPHLLRIVGPRSLGIMVPGVGLNASFGHAPPLTGNLAFVAQSATVLTAVLDWATSQGIGFSKCVALGEMADVDFGDMLDYLAYDYSTQAILLYTEGITGARKFISAARAVARIKPVIVVKAGRHGQTVLAAGSCPGFPVGSDAVYDAAFIRTGMLRVKDMQALFNAVQTLAMARQVSGNRLAILTNGRGMGVMATDTLIDRGGRLAALGPDTLERLNQILPSAGSHGNPVDIMNDAPDSRYGDALEALVNDRGTDAVLVIHCPSAVASSTEASNAVINTLQNKISTYNRKLILTCWIGNESTQEARRIFTENRIPTYTTPAEAVRGFMQIVRYHKSQEMLMETPPNISEVFTPDSTTVQKIIDGALAESRSWLTASEAMAVLAAYAIPVVATHEASSPEAAAGLAERIGGPTVLKIVSPDITHKSDVSGVSLNLETPDVVRKNAAAMLERVRHLRPDAHFQGLTVQPMVHRPHAHELIIGMADDALFGPVLMVGHGGMAVEVIEDKALALPPLNMKLAHEVMARTRVYRLLQGYPGMPGADLDSIALTLVKISQLVCDIADIAELEINPLLADAHGVQILDARIKLVKALRPAMDRLAIHPYPKELEETLNLPDGQILLIRPIRPEDEPGFQKIFASLSPEEIRLRFLHPMNTLPHTLAARLTQIDYDREMALVVEGKNKNGESELYGLVQLSADPDKERGEFAILLRRDMTGLGLGPMLLRRIIDYAGSQGIGEVFGDVLSENKSMLKLCRVFGFQVTSDREDPGNKLVSLKL